VTCVDPAVIQALSLAWHGVIPVNMPAGTGMTFSSLYRASITILHPSGKPGQHFLAEDWPVGELPLRVLGYNAVMVHLRRFATNVHVGVDPIQEKPQRARLRDFHRKRARPRASAHASA
jgi:hypothetical protein